MTPHALRHTYISILLLVTDNVPYVMEQVGHDDEATTTRIYRHLIRQRQEHGRPWTTSSPGPARASAHPQSPLIVGWRRK